MKKLAWVLLGLLATLLLSLGLSWLLPIASHSSDIAFVAGLGGSAVLLFLYWEVLKLCVRHFRREISMRTANPDPAATPKELKP